MINNYYFPSHFFLSRKIIITAIVLKTFKINRFYLARAITSI